MNFQQQVELARTASFIERVQGAMVKSAIAVSSEDLATVAHVTRVQWATQVLRDPAHYAARMEWLWDDATHASRKADLIFSAWDTAQREGMRIRGMGSEAGLSSYGGTPVVRGSALTAQLTTITFTAPITPDYAIQDLTAGGFGFVTKDEGNTVLSVIANLQVRVAELEARLNAATGVNLIA